MSNRIIKKDVRRLVKPTKSPNELLADLKNALNSGNNDNAELIKSIIKVIHEEYTYEKYMEKNGGNSRKMSDSVFKMLKGEGKRDLTVSNLDTNYLQYIRGKCDVNEFERSIEKLFGELIREFDELEEWFLTGKIENKEVNYYERT